MIEKKCSLCKQPDQSLEHCTPCTETMPLHFAHPKHAQVPLEPIDQETKI